MKLWQVEVIVDSAGSHGEAYLVTLWAPSIGLARDGARVAIEANISRGQTIRDLSLPKELTDPASRELIALVSIEPAGPR